MSLSYVGRVEIPSHYTPAFNWGAPVGRNGWRTVTISGRINWNLAWAIHELVSNPHLRQTILDEVGVLEVVWAGDSLQSPFNGWYLLQECSIDAAQKDSLTDIVPWSLSGIRLGNKAPVIVRSARARENSFSLDTQSTVVQPFWGEEYHGHPFAQDPGGTISSREYDDRTLYDPSARVRNPETYAFWADPVATWADPVKTWSSAGRRLRIHSGDLT